AEEPDEDGVAGGGVEGVALLDADLLRGPAVDGLRADVARALGGLVERARDGAETGRRTDRVVLADGDAALAGEVAEAAAEVAVEGGGDAELAGECLGLERAIALLADRGQDLRCEVIHAVDSSRPRAAATLPCSSYRPGPGSLHDHRLQLARGQVEDDERLR